MRWKGLDEASTLRRCESFRRGPTKTFWDTEGERRRIPSGRPAPQPNAHQRPRDRPTASPPSAPVGELRKSDNPDYQICLAARGPAAHLDITRSFMSPAAKGSRHHRGAGARWAERDGKHRVLRTPSLPKKHHTLGPSWASPCGPR